MEKVLLMFTLINIGVVELQTPPNLSCYTPRPSNPSCTDKYAAFPGHLNCEDRITLIGRPITLSPEELILVADEHNRIRSSVSPKAANMLDMHENQGLASAATRWARRCKADSTWYQRTTPGAFIPGQNYLFSATPMNWTDVIAVWESEKTHFEYGGHGNDAARVGNYTQIIWSEAASVGCGGAECNGRFLYICLYAPILDPVKLDKPYKQSDSNLSCDDCSGHCNSTIGLCDFKGVICLGGSKVNMTTGVCVCLNDVHFNGTICDLECDGTNDTDPECFTTLRGTCGTKLDTMFRCPWMCNVCPYADSSWGSTNISRMPWEKGIPDCTTTPPTTSTSSNVAGSSTPDQDAGQDNNGVAAPMHSQLALATWGTIAILLVLIF